MSTMKFKFTVEKDDLSTRLLSSSPPSFHMDVETSKTCAYLIERLKEEIGIPQERRRDYNLQFMVRYSNYTEKKAITLSTDDETTIQDSKTLTDMQGHLIHVTIVKKNRYQTECKQLRRSGRGAAKEAMAGISEGNWIFDKMKQVEKEQAKKKREKNENRRAAEAKKPKVNNQAFASRGKALNDPESDPSDKDEDELNDVNEGGGSSVNLALWDLLRGTPGTSFGVDDEVVSGFSDDIENQLGVNDDDHVLAKKYFPRDRELVESIANPNKRQKNIMKKCFEKEREDLDAFYSGLAAFHSVESGEYHITCWKYGQVWKEFGRAMNEDENENDDSDFVTVTFKNSTAVDGRRGQNWNGHFEFVILCESLVKSTIGIFAESEEMHECLNPLNTAALFPCLFWSIVYHAKDKEGKKSLTYIDMLKELRSDIDFTDVKKSWLKRS